MIETLERFLQAEWAGFCPGARAPRRVRIALLSSSREPDGTRVLLAFAGGETAPTLVARIPRLPGGSARLEREWRRLRSVWASLPDAIRPWLPEPLCMTTVRGMPVFIQRALPGRNLKTAIQRGLRPVTRRQLRRDLRAMDRWLDAFQGARPVRGGEGRDIPGRPRVAECLQGARTALLDARLVAPRQVDWLLEQAAAVDTAFSSRPPVWVHGDLWPGNVMADGKRWGVIDWDEVSVGPPWIDRVWFAFHAAALFYARRDRDPDLRIALGKVMFDPRGFASPVRRYLDNVFASCRVQGGSAVGAVAVLLACQAAPVLLGHSTRRVFPLAAPEILRAWFADTSLRPVWPAAGSRKAP